MGLWLGIGLGLYLVSGWFVDMHAYLYYFPLSLSPSCSTIWDVFCNSDFGVGQTMRFEYPFPEINDIKCVGWSIVNFGRFVPSSLHFSLRIRRCEYPAAAAERRLVRCVFT